MAKIAPYVFVQEFDNNGDPLAGGLLYTYEAGTTTPKATYTDSTEATANANPVVLDASGRANVWLDSGSYKFVLKTSADVLVKEVDNIVGEASNVFGATVTNISTNTTVTASYQNNILDCTAALTLSLLDVETAGEGFLFTVKNSGVGNVTIDPDASELIDGAATATIFPTQSCLVVCDGTGWKTIFLGQFRKNNYSATSAPTTSDDSDNGYAEGSVWYDTTNDESYVCLDASTGAAVWLNTTLTINDLGAAALKGVDTDFTSPTNDDLPTTLAVENRIDALHSFDTSQATTSGTSFDFTVPGGTKEIVITMSGVGLSGTNPIIAQLGDSGGVETTGYTFSRVDQIASGGTNSSSAGLVLARQSYPVSGRYVITLYDGSSNKWIGSGAVSNSLSVQCASGEKSLSGTITTVRITRDGSDTFNAGSVNVNYRF